MIRDNTVKNCTACFLCGDLCPVNAISIISDESGFFRVKIDSARCVHCNVCSTYCPQQSSRVSLSKLQNLSRQCFAAWSADMFCREHSSSGGVFGSIAKKFLADGNYVVGAGLVNGKIHHIIINDLNQLKTIQGSKYGASNLTGIYIRVKKLLQQQKKVLFSGTPCQTTAMIHCCSDSERKYLYTLDFVCHGIPSGKLLTLSEPEPHCVPIGYRDKADSWKRSYAMTWRTPDGEILRIPQKNNIFIQMFGANFANRSVCYRCKFNGRRHQADITCSDFWGIERFQQEQPDGISGIMINTPRGKELVSRSDLRLEPCSFSEMAKSNPRWYCGFNALRFVSFRLWLNRILNRWDHERAMKLLSGNFRNSPQWFIYHVQAYLLQKIQSLVQFFCRGMIR